MFDNQVLGMNCYGGRNEVLQSAGISGEVPDMPWSRLEENFGYSRSISMSSSDPYYSYSLKMQQQITFLSPGVKSIETQSWSRYQTHPQMSIVPSWDASEQFRYNNPSGLSSGPIIPRTPIRLQPAIQPALRR